MTRRRTKIRIAAFSHQMWHQKRLNNKFLYQPQAKILWIIYYINRDYTHKEEEIAIPARREPMT